jgi:hypothetical protein
MSLPDIKPDSELFHTCTKTGYSKQVMGKNFIHQIGKNVATELGLDDPAHYTGHCFRRTAATAAANSGANTLEMKRHFGWQQEATALKYVDETKDRARKMAQFLTGNNSTAAAIAPTTAPATITSSQVLMATTNQIGMGTASHTLQVSQEDGKKLYNFDFANASNVTLNFQ